MPYVSSAERKPNGPRACWQQDTKQSPLADIRAANGGSQQLLPQKFEIEGFSLYNALDAENADAAVLPVCARRCSAARCLATEELH